MRTPDGEFYLDEYGNFTQAAEDDRHGKDSNLLSHLKYLSHDLAIESASTRYMMNGEGYKPDIDEWMDGWSDDEKIRFAILILRMNGTPATLFAADQLLAMSANDFTPPGDNSPTLGGKRKKK